MSVRLYDRRARLIIGEVDIASEGEQGLQMSFTVNRALKRSANTAEILIHNLSDGTRAKIDGNVRRLVLEAGYVDTLASVFTGDRAWVTHSREMLGWLTTIEGGAGMGALTRKFSGSDAPGVPASTLAKDVLQSAGLAVNIAALEGMLGNLTYAGGKAAVGNVRDILRELAADAGIEFSVQDGEALFLAPRQVSNLPAFFLSADNGLVGSPSRVRDPQRPRANIIKGASLLQPGIVPGRRLVLDSVALKGTFKVTSCTHAGDTHGDGESWLTQWEAIEV